MRDMRTAALLTATLLAAAIIVAGCGKTAEEAPASAPAEPAHMEPPDEHGGHDEHGAAAVPPAATPTEETDAVAAKAQTSCPVMGGAIDKNIFADHDGERVYFCCEQCVATFKADPEKYLGKMAGQGVQLDASPL